MYTVERKTLAVENIGESILVHQNFTYQTFTVNMRAALCELRIFAEKDTGDMAIFILLYKAIQSFVHANMLTIQ